MNLLALLTAMSVSAVLLAAALAKLREPRAMEETLRRLGFKGGARPGVWLLITTELGVGTALPFRPDSAWSQMGIVMLALAFAGAGAFAILRRESIACSCFGSSARPLGRAQLIALIPFVAAAGVLRLFIRKTPSLVEGAALFATVSIVLAVRAAWPAWVEFRRSRSDRRSAEEMYLWLPSR